MECDSYYTWYVEGCAKSTRGSLRLYHHMPLHPRRTLVSIRQPLKSASTNTFSLKVVEHLMFSFNAYWSSE